MRDRRSALIHSALLNSHRRADASIGAGGGPLGSVGGANQSAALVDDALEGVPIGCSAEELFFIG